MRIDLESLFPKYSHELYALGRAMRRQYHHLLARNFRATFADVEGELLYMLVRELQPEIVFEISPDCGWSTNYLLAAVTANARGTVHSFELAEQLHGIPVEKAIRSNLYPAWDQSRFVLHVGDAMQTTQQVPGEIQFLLLDSCHEAFFARWYISELFPRVNGIAFVQDIAFADELEPSGEAECLWEWAESARPEMHVVGALERQIGSRWRQEFPERRGARCNSVLFQLPILQSGKRPALEQGPRALLDAAREAWERGAAEQADRLLNRIVRLIMADPMLLHRHRLLAEVADLYQQLGEPAEAERCLQRALGTVVQSDRFQRSKGLRELTRIYRKRRQWRLLTWACSLRLLQAVAPGAAGGSTAPNAALPPILPAAQIRDAA